MVFLTFCIRALFGSHFPIFIHNVLHHLIDYVPIPDDQRPVCQGRSEIVDDVWLGVRSCSETQLCAELLRDLIECFFRVEVRICKLQSQLVTGQQALVITFDNNAGEPIHRSKLI